MLSWELGHAVYLRTASDSKTKDKLTNCCGGIDGDHGLSDTGSRGKPATPIEAVIESILTQMSDNCTTVEFWWRDEWISMDAIQTSAPQWSTGGGMNGYHWMPMLISTRS
jgi:hypothetical protein